MTAVEELYLAKLDAMEKMQGEPVFHGNGTVTAVGTAEDMRRAADALSQRIEVDTRTPRQRFDSAVQLARARNALGSLKASTRQH